MPLRNRGYDSSPFLVIAVSCRPICLIGDLQEIVLGCQSVVCLARRACRNHDQNIDHAGLVFGNLNWDQSANFGNLTVKSFHLSWGSGNVES